MVRAAFEKMLATGTAAHHDEHVLGALLFETEWETARAVETGKDTEKLQKNYIRKLQKLIRDSAFRKKLTKQALRLNQKMPTETCWMVMESLKDHDTLGLKVREDVIGVFLQSSMFEEASKNLTKLMKFRPFSADQLVRIIKGSSRNQNIYGCHRAQRPMESLLEDARAKVPKRTIARYRKAVKSWPY